MTWTKLSDDYSDDCWTLSDAAFRLHTEGLVWSNRKLLDLRLDKSEMRRWAKHPEAALELIAVGWWRDGGDDYVIVHHGGYQRTREQVLNQQAVNLENARKGGRPPKPAREQAHNSRRETDSVSDSVSDSQTDSETERDGTGYLRNQSLATSSSAPPPSEATTGEAHSDRPRVVADRLTKLGGKAVGCPCGRPAPINSETGLCYWCERAANKAGAP